MQFQFRVRQRVGDKACQRWTSGPSNYFRRLVHDNDAANHDVIASLNKPARADVRQARAAVLVQVIHFYDAYGIRSIDILDDGGVTAWWKRGDDRRFRG